LADIEIEIDGNVFKGVLLDGEAPDTCMAVLGALPVQGDVAQTRWSGGAVYIAVPHLLRDVLLVENGTIYGSQGDVLLIDFRRPGRKPEDEQEILIVYDKRGAQFRNWDGPEVVNLFAKITENLDLLQKIGENIWKTGIRKVVIKRPR
jgi:hypothetical protein